MEFKRFGKEATHLGSVACSPSTQDPSPLNSNSQLPAMGADVGNSPQYRTSKSTLLGGSALAEKSDDFCIHFLEHQLNLEGLDLEDER